MIKPFLIISLSVLSRLIPHAPNFSPEIILALYLGMKSRRQFAFLNIVLMAIISDLLISVQHPHFSGFGDWTLFTYSALLAIGGIGLLIKQKGFSLLFIESSGIATLFYWLWTNFGTWLTSGLYPHTLIGWSVCLTTALPFLASSLLVNAIGCALIIAIENFPLAFFHELKL